MSAAVSANALARGRSATVHLVITEARATNEAEVRDADHDLDPLALHVMGLFRRRRKTAHQQDEPSPREAQRATLEYFAEFVRTRVGVEAYVEPETNVTQTTVVLIATTGEWTRRKVPDTGAARKIAEELGIPVYDVQRTGYPPRMREWNARQRPGGRT